MGTGSLYGQRILVTGATGFIGCYLCQMLEEKGAIVRRASRRSGDDLADNDTADRIIREWKPESIFHLASEVTGSRDLKVVLPTLRNNLLTTINVLLGASRHDVSRLVCMGSLQEPSSALAEPANSPYAASKYSATAYARMFASLYGLSVTIARTFMVYGPAQHDTSKVLPHTITRLLEEQAVQLSSGRQQFDWIHVRDVVEGLLAIHRSRDLDGRVVDLGTGKLTSVAEVVSSAGQLLGRTHLLQFGVLKDRVGEPVLAANVDETHHLTGWRPAVTLAEGIRDTVEWYRARMQASGGSR